MKNLTFRLLGLISSLLVTAGLLGAAQHLDPLTHSMAKQPSIAALTDSPAGTCSRACNYLESAVKDLQAGQR